MIIYLACLDGWIIFDLFTASFVLSFDCLLCWFLSIDSLLCFMCLCRQMVRWMNSLQLSKDHRTKEFATIQVSLILSSDVN